MRCSVLGVLALAVVVAAPAAAQQRDVNVSTSQLPYWEVGVLDSNLSTLCANGRFNEAQLYAYRIVFNGPIGPGVVGVAKTGWNLSDIARAAEPDTSYYFYRDKTTNCQVFKWGPTDTPKKQGAGPLDYNPYRPLVEQSYQYRLTPQRSVGSAVTKP
jgi:hypothetical protein